MLLSAAIFISFSPPGTTNKSLGVEAEGAFAFLTPVTIILPSI